MAKNIPDIIHDANIPHLKYYASSIFTPSPQPRIPKGPESIMASLDLGDRIWAYSVINKTWYKGIVSQKYDGYLIKIFCKSYSSHKRGGVPLSTSEFLSSSVSVPIPKGKRIAPYDDVIEAE